MIDRRELLQYAAGTLALAALGPQVAAPAAATAAPARRRVPNFVVVFCDDLGLGDIGATGGRTIKTPHLDRMAAEGVVLSDFYAAANMCTPSRAGLLTGRYAVRSGLGHQVLLLRDTHGLPLSEVTIAKALKPDYATALIGKWHLGHVAPYWPPKDYGFDLFYGIPYSHDMAPLALVECYSQDGTVTQEPVDLPRLQQRFWARAERFIEDNAQRPFFLELALSAPHLPAHPIEPFKGRSAAGAYGDAVEEIDDIVGRLMAKLDQLGLSQDTLLVFTSDNGPWFEGSAGSLRQRKGGGGYDGGYRVPFIARQPGTVPAGRVVNSMAMGIDLLPTFCALSGRPPPAGVRLDGRDISAVLLQGAASPHEELLLFDNEDVVAVRTQRWKYVTTDHYRGLVFRTDKQYPQLYDVAADTSESYSLASLKPEVLADMQQRLARAKAEFAPLKTRRAGSPSGPPAMTVIGD